MNGNFLQEESLEREMGHNNTGSLSSCELEQYVKLYFRDTRGVMTKSRHSPVAKLCGSQLDCPVSF